MGEEKVIFEWGKRMDCVEAASYLRTLADQLAAGAITPEPGAAESLLLVPHEIVLEIKAKKKTKKDGTKFSLEVEIEWKVAAPAGGEAPASPQGG
ncbi:MAG: amphi-Trp domain-containing protein [Deltaproteobacteria bacterium]